MCGPFCPGSLKNTFFFLPSVCKHWTKGWQIKGKANTNCRGVVWPQDLASAAPWQTSTKSLDLYGNTILQISSSTWTSGFLSHCFAITMNKSATQIMSRYTLTLYFHMKTALFLTILSITSCFSIDYIDCLLCCFSHNQRRSENRHVSQSAATERENQRRALFHLRQKPDIERVKRASVCPVWEGFLTCTMCHIFHILIVKFAAIARRSHRENQDDWEALCRASAVLLMEMFLQRRPLASLLGFTKRIFGWWAEGFCSWRDNRVGSDLSNVS